MEHAKHNSLVMQADLNRLNFKFKVHMSCKRNYSVSVKLNFLQKTPEAHPLFIFTIWWRRDEEEEENKPKW